mmetsp:Transcript_73454/g.220741  ORF Transcript_73454/g.220741 Transcript_73454/m.220741 type:complete len:262 (-) Transcript_73454:324-1109(-)
MFPSGKAGVCRTMVPATSVPRRAARPRCSPRRPNDARSRPRKKSASSRGRRGEVAKVVVGAVAGARRLKVAKIAKVIRGGRLSPTHAARARVREGAARPRARHHTAAQIPQRQIARNRGRRARTVALGGAAGGAARGVWPAGGGGARAPALGGGASKPPPGGGASTPVPNSRGFLGAPALLPGTLTLMESVSPSLSDRSRIGSVAARASISARSWSASFCRSTPFQWSCSVALKSYEKLRSRKPMPINAWRPLPSSILNTK